MKRVNKSKAIREILAQQPAATVKEIQTALGAKRIKASAGLISKVKYTKASKKRIAHANGKVSGATFDQLLAAKGLVDRVGSVETARSALDALAKLIEA
jgi:hypothetical protein